MSDASASGGALERWKRRKEVFLLENQLGHLWNDEFDDGGSDANPSLVYTITNATTLKPTAKPTLKPTLMPKMIQGQAIDSWLLHNLASHVHTLTRSHCTLIHSQPYFILPDFPTISFIFRSELFFRCGIRSNALREITFFLFVFKRGSIHRSVHWSVCRLVHLSFRYA